MKIVKSFFILLFVLFIGVQIKQLIPYTLPEMIYGLIFLLVLLFLKIVKLEDIELTATNLVSMLPLFLIPTCVKVIESFDILKANGLALFFVVFISFFLTIISTAITVKFLRGKNVK